MSILDEIDMMDEEELTRQAKRLKKALEVIKAKSQLARLAGFASLVSPGAQAAKSGSDDPVEFYRRLLRERQALKMFEEAVKAIEREEKKEESDGGSTRSPLASLIASLAAQGMKPEEINEFIQKLDPRVLALLASSPSRDQGLNAALLLALAGRGREEGGSIRDVAELLAALQNQPTLLDAIRTGAELGAGQGQVVASLMNALVELAKVQAQQQVETLRREIEELKERVQYSDPREVLKALKEDAEFWRRVFGEGGREDPRVRLLLKKMELDLERWKAEQDLSMRKWLLERESDMEKTRAVLNALVKPLVERAGPIVDSLAKDLSEAVKKKASEGVAAPQPQQPPTATITCPKCGKPFEVQPTPSGEWPDVVKCPHCGQEMERSV